MQTKIILALGLALLLLATLFLAAGCGGTNLLTGSSAAIPDDKPPVLVPSNETFPAEGKNLVTGSVK